MRTASLALLSLLTISCKPLHPATSETLFSAGEHKVLGDDGYRKACAESGACPAVLHRADKKETFTYGELVAFSGDFYETPFEIYNERHSQSLIHPFAANTKRIKEAFAEEEAAMRQQMSNKDVVYPDNNLGFFFAFPKYLELATRNTNHFGWQNMKFYVKYHAEALSMALKARALKNDAKKVEQLTRALFLNAFADHFLTDAYATGHLRNPRAQALRWQEKNGYGKTAVDSLAKLLHDNDHLLKTTHGPGLKVRNARGDAWHTRCDGELFTLAQKSDPQIAIPVDAIQLSVKEVLAAYSEGILPSGVYAATELVPYLDPAEDALISVFNDKVSDEQIELWLKSLGVISNFNRFIGLTPKLTRTFFAALPGIMQDFRNDVAKESLDPELTLRLPAAYIEGFKNVK